MFWSPAVTRLRVACCCAPAGAAPTATTASAAMTMPNRLIGASLLRVLLRFRGWCHRVYMQSRFRQGNPDPLPDRQPARIVDQVLPRADAHRVAIKTARIRALHDPAGQDEAAVNCFAGRA